MRGSHPVSLRILQMQGTLLRMSSKLPSGYASEYARDRPSSFSLSSFSLVLIIHVVEVAFEPEFPFLLS